MRNDAARFLATGSTNSIGMVLADLDNSLFVDMAHGAQQGADAVGLRLILGNAACSLDRQDDYLQLFDESRVAGVLLSPMEDSLAGIERMRSHDRPIVLLNYAQEGVDCCTVLVDNEQVGDLAARHLIETGRKRIAFVAGRDYYQPVHARRVGVQRAVARAPGVTLEEIDTDGLRFEDGLAAARPAQWAPGRASGPTASSRSPTTSPTASPKGCIRRSSRRCPATSASSAARTTAPPRVDR